MAQEDGNKDVTLDDLLRIVESAARRIESLQAENAALVQQVRDAESAAQQARAEAQEKARRLEELEQAEAALRTDAEWCRWFKGRYGESTFYTHIEREYEFTQRRKTDAPRSPESGIVPDAP